MKSYMVYGWRHSIITMSVLQWISRVFRITHKKNVNVVPFDETIQLSCCSLSHFGHTCRCIQVSKQRKAREPSFFN